MAHYLVKAQYQKDLLAELRTRLDSGEINRMRPFGTSLQFILDHARLDPRGRVGSYGRRRITAIRRLRRNAPLYWTPTLHP